LVVGFFGGFPTFGRRVNLRLHLPVAGGRRQLHDGGRIGTGGYTCRWPDDGVCLLVV